MSRGTGSVEKWLPLGYFGAAVLLVAVLLPTVLRPPQQPPTQSAELSPDAPPDDEQQSIISSLSRASSATAGTVDGLTGETAPPPTIPPKAVEPNSCPFGFGNPKRQTESVYSPPCAPAFRGDNGGATWKNVFPDEIRIGFSHVLGNAKEGRISTTPESNESSQTRTMRVLQDYWNQRMQTYGRRIALYQLPASSANVEEQMQDAALAADQYQVFAAQYLYPEFCKEIARRQLISYCNPLPRATYEANAPYLWSWMPDFDKIDAFSAEYLCKKVLGRPAKFAGVGVQNEPRKIGLAFESAGPRNGGRKATALADAMKAECGAEAPVAVEFNVDESNGQASYVAAIGQLRSQGVTSVVIVAETVPTLGLMNVAESQGWNPEWMIFAAYGLDNNTIGLLMPQNQMAHTFGVSGWELPAPVARTECGKAYRSIDPSQNPDGTTCAIFFGQIQQILNGIQMAGPNLTPATFEKGQFQLGYRFPPEQWAISGGYGPGDHTYQETFGEIWWDRSAQAPETGAPGAYRWTNNGKRYKKGELTSDDSQLFTEGILFSPDQ